MGWCRSCAPQSSSLRSYCGRSLRLFQGRRGCIEAGNMTADFPTARHVEEPAPASPAHPRHSAGHHGSAPAKKKAEEFPIRISLNITEAMSASLARLHKRMRLKEAVIARLGLMHWLASQDHEYRED